MSMRDVTPIKVRGRKKPKPLITAMKSSSNLISSIPTKRHIDADVSSQRSYPLGASIGNKPYSGRITPYSALPTYSTYRTVPSKLEQLPTEILEHIFLYSLNVSLPRSSPLIGGKLASQHTYRIFSLEIFHGYKDNYGNRYTIDRRLGDPKVLAKARKEALQCRWMTGTFFGTLREAGIKAEQARINSVFSEHSEAYWDFHNSVNIDLGDDCPIPSRLLRWPIDEDALLLLRELRECGAKIDWVNTTSGELATRNWEYALKARDWMLIALLSDFGVGHQEGDLPTRSVVLLDDWDFDMLERITAEYPESVLSRMHFDGNAIRNGLVQWSDPVVTAKVRETVEHRRSTEEEA